jgi:hypothetical protein
MPLVGPASLLGLTQTARGPRARHRSTFVCAGVSGRGWKPTSAVSRLPVVVIPRNSVRELRPHFPDYIRGAQNESGLPGTISAFGRKADHPERPRIALAAWSEGGWWGRWPWWDSASSWSRWPVPGPAGQQITAKFDQEKRQQFATAAAFRAFLRQTGQTIADVRFRVRLNLIYEALIKHEGGKARIVEAQA